jgi:hypothetical protein
MSGRRRQGLAPTLFPFLAVLVCTLGTLILLLALVAQNAGEAIASADKMPTSEAESPDAAADLGPTPEQIAQAEALAEASEQIEREIREAAWHRQQTIKMRDQQTADLEARRDRRAHLEDHVRRLRLELESLTTEVEATIDQQGDVAKVQETLDKLLLEIDSEKEAIGNLQAELQSETPRIVIVPHKGPNGTDRRPVYIECGKDGVLIQPGNIRISQAELEPRTGFPNPLEAALRTIRLHATQTYGDEIAPYPLLVVRPDGIKSYGIARAAMNNWDDQFGYELVPAEVDLAFPETDPVLSNKVIAVVRETVRQRDQLAIRFGGGGSAGGNGSGPGGYDGGYDGGYGDDGQYDQQSGLARQGGSANEPAMGYVGSGQLATGGAAGGTSQSPGGTLGGTPSPAASTLPVLSAARMSRGATNGAIGESQLRGFSALSNNSSPTGNSSGTAIASPTNDPATSNPGTNTPSSISASGPVYDNAYGSGLAEATAGPNTQSGMPLQSPTGQQATGPSSLNAPDGSVIADTKATGQFAGGTSASSAGSSSSSSASSSSASGGSTTSRTTSNVSGGTGGSQSSGQVAQSSQNSQGQPGQTGNSDSQPTDGPQSPSLNMNANNTPPVRRVGKDWALPPDLSSSRGTEMLRMIRVECYSDRFVLIAEGGRGVPTVIPFADGDINAASLTLATAVRDRAAGWGAAMQGARWQPVLEVAVAPGADYRYQQLTRLLDGSGLMIQAKGAR